MPTLVYPQYKTVFVNYSPFYVFALGRKPLGCIPAGISLKSGKHEYTTAQLLESIFAYWRQHHTLPSTLSQKRQPHDWLTSNNRFDKHNFIRLCVESSVRS